MSPSHLPPPTTVKILGVRHTILTLFARPTLAASTDGMDDECGCLLRGSSCEPALWLAPES
jgi:hypothetical protein